MKKFSLAICPYILLLTVVLSLNSAFAQRPPERIIDPERKEEFVHMMDSVVSLYEQDSAWRVPIWNVLKPGSFEDSLVRYNLNEYVAYLNNYWYKLDSTTTLSLSNAAPQSGFTASSDGVYGINKKVTFCDCGRQHIWGLRLKNLPESDEDNHYVIGVNWWKFRSRWFNYLSDRSSESRFIKKLRKRTILRNRVSDRNLKQLYKEQSNYGIVKKEFLRGDIGYFKWTNVPNSTSFSREQIEDLVREFLFSNSLILDLRGSSYDGLPRFFYPSEKSHHELQSAVWIIERFLHPDSTHFLGKAQLLKDRLIIHSKTGKTKELVQNPTFNLETSKEDYKLNMEKTFFHEGFHVFHNLQNFLNTKEYKKKYTLRYYERPLYILVDRNTSDVAELIAYALQKHRPSTTVIGERTAGKTVINRGEGIISHVGMSVPALQMQEMPWENVGIRPDILVSKYDTTSADRAFDVAYRMGIDDFFGESSRRNEQKYGRRILAMDKITQPLRAKYPMPKDTTFYLGKYQFGKEIILKEGMLWLKNYHKLTPIYQTQPNQFFVGTVPTAGVAQSRYRGSAVPMTLFFRKMLNNESLDSVTAMYVRYADHTSARYDKVVDYKVSDFIQNTSAIDTAGLTRPSASYPFSKMSFSEKKLLFEGLTLQRPFPKMDNQPTLSGGNISDSELKNQISVFVFWSPTSQKSIELIPKLNQLVEDYAAQSVAVIGISKKRPQDLEEFIIGTPFYADIIPLSTDLFEQFFVPNEPTVLIRDREGNIIFGKTSGNQENMDILINQVKYSLNNHLKMIEE